jgi:hypothetical protein
MKILRIVAPPTPATIVAGQLATICPHTGIEANTRQPGYVLDRICGRTAGVFTHLA